MAIGAWASTGGSSALCARAHLLVECLLVPIELVVREVKVCELLQRRILKVLPSITRGLRVGPCADQVMRQVEVRESLEAPRHTE